MVYLFFCFQNNKKCLILMILSDYDSVMLIHILFAVACYSPFRARALRLVGQSVTCCEAALACGRYKSISAWYRTRPNRFRNITRSFFFKKIRDSRRGLCLDDCRGAGRPKSMSAKEEDLLTKRVERLLAKFGTITNDDIRNEASEIVLQASGTFHKI